jgi:hypothetical protein
LPREVRITATFQLGLAHCYSGDWRTADRDADALADLLRPDDPSDLHAFLPDLRSLARLVAGDYHAVLTISEDAIAGYTDSSTQDSAGYQHNVRGLAHLHLDDLPAAEDDLRLGAQIGAEYGIGQLEGMCLTNLAWGLARATRWDAAADAAAAGAQRLTAQGVRAAATAEAIVAALHSADRTADGIRRHLDDAVAGSRDNTDFYQPPLAVIEDLVRALTAA